MSDKVTRLTVNAIRVRLVAFGLDDSRFSPVQATQDCRGSGLAGSKSGPANDWPAGSAYITPTTHMLLAPGRLLHLTD